MIFFKNITSGHRPMPLPLAQNFNFKSGLRGDQYLIELECLRGVAILLVFFFHAYGISLGKLVGTGNIFLSYIISGNTGVTLFFVLSGFLLSYPGSSTETVRGTPHRLYRTILSPGHCG